jgi:hypothetical protein
LSRGRRAIFFLFLPVDLFVLFFHGREILRRNLIVLGLIRRSETLTPTLSQPPAPLPGEGALAVSLLSRWLVGRLGEEGRGGEGPGGRGTAVILAK